MIFTKKIEAFKLTTFFNFIDDLLKFIVKKKKKN